MKLARNSMLVAAGVLVLLGAVTSQVVAQELRVVKVVTEVRPRQNDLLPMLENHSNISGVSSDVTGDPKNFCLGAKEDTEFSPGDTLALSIRWNDSITCPEEGCHVGVLHEYDVLWGARFGGHPPVFREIECDFGTTGLEGGFDFCCATFVEIPPLSPEGAQVPVVWAGRVTAVDRNGGSSEGIPPHSIQGVPLGDFVIKFVD